MNASRPVLLFAVLVLAGCQSAKDDRNPSTPPAKPTKREAVEITPASSLFDQRRSTVKAAETSRDKNILTEGDIVTFPKFVVTAEGFANFGFSVITNPEVRRGGMIKWMCVGMVLPDSIAARSGLVTGDQILAIDGVPVTDLTRSAMLQALFEREIGDQPRLAVLDRRRGHLPTFVTLDENGPSSR